MIKYIYERFIVPSVSAFNPESDYIIETDTTTWLENVNEMNTHQQSSYSKLVFTIQI